MGVLVHLMSLVPGDPPPHLGGEPDDRVGQSLAHQLGPWPAGKATGITYLVERSTSVPRWWSCTVHRWGPTAGATSNERRRGTGPPGLPRRDEADGVRQYVLGLSAEAEEPPSCSGMAGIDPETGSVPDGIAVQTEQALVNLAAVLGAAGSSMDQLVKTTIFYSDGESYAAINEIYSRHMPNPPPVRSAPANVALPRGLLISIDAIAALPGA